MTDIWNFQTQLTRRLSYWSIASIAIGLPLLSVDLFWRGVGIQFIVWGAIDLLIAIFGSRSASRRKARLSPDELLDTAPKETANLKRILLINTALDVFYVAGGIALIFTLGADNPEWRGHGWGIIMQGGFLFFFDLIHALKLK
jgi:D-alanyl-lipoteichoic acid acyltransferase DltB (MBOAT superfamily)